MPMFWIVLIAALAVVLGFMAYHDRRTRGRGSADGVANARDVIAVKARNAYPGDTGSSWSGGATG